MELGQAYHPPLYYLLAWPIFQQSGSFKLVQSLSLVLSILTLFVLYHLIYRTGLLANAQARFYSFLLACFSPQFIMFTLYVSNDALTILLGCCTALLVIRYVHSPDRKNLACLGLATALGLLSKATFLAYLPVLFLLICFVTIHRSRSLANALVTASVFLALVAVAGSYKFVDNYRYYRNPFIANIDSHASWYVKQAQSYQGFWSYLNFNLPSLLISPSLSPVTERAYPLLLYATFWYQHIPESNFIGCYHRPFSYIGSVIYALAVFPTAVLVAGLFHLVKGSPRFLRSFDHTTHEDRQLLNLYAVVGLFLANFALIFAAVLKYHVWSIMQGRLLFPSLFGMLAAFGVGAEIVERRRRPARALKLCMISLTGLFLVYLSGEIGFQLLFRG